MRNRFLSHPSFTQERFLECITVEKIFFIIITISHILVSHFFALLTANNILVITLPNKVKNKLLKTWMDYLLFLHVVQAWTYVE